jgi:hypothetical protein
MQANQQLDLRMTPPTSAVELLRGAPPSQTPQASQATQNLQGFLDRGFRGIPRESRVDYRAFTDFIPPLPKLEDNSITFDTTQRPNWDIDKWMDNLPKAEKQRIDGFEGQEKANAIALAAVRDHTMGSKLEYHLQNGLPIAADRDLYHWTRERLGDTRYHEMFSPKWNEVAEGAFDYLTRDAAPGVAKYLFNTNRYDIDQSAALTYAWASGIATGADWLRRGALRLTEKAISGADFNDDDVWQSREMSRQFELKNIQNDEKYEEALTRAAEFGNMKLEDVRDISAALEVFADPIELPIAGAGAAMAVVKPFSKASKFGKKILNISDEAAQGTRAAFAATTAEIKEARGQLFRVREQARKLKERYIDPARETLDAARRRQDAKNIPERQAMREAMAETRGGYIGRLWAAKNASKIRTLQADLIRYADDPVAQANIQRGIDALRHPSQEALDNFAKRADVAKEMEEFQNFVDNPANRDLLTSDDFLDDLGDLPKLPDSAKPMAERLARAQARFDDLVESTRTWSAKVAALSKRLETEVNTVVSGQAKQALAPSRARRAAGGAVSAVGRATRDVGDSVQRMAGAIDDWVADKVGESGAGMARGMARGMLAQSVGGAAIIGLNEIFGEDIKSRAASAALGLTAGIAIWNAPKAARHMGKFINTIGQTYAQGRMLDPFWRRVTHDTYGFSNWAARKMQPFDYLPTQRLEAGAMGAVHGALYMGAFGYVGSGGDLNTAFGQALGMSPMGFAAGLAGSFHPIYSKQQRLKQLEAQRQRVLTRMSPDTVAQFESRPLPTQWAISNYLHVFPDLKIEADADFFTRGGRKIGEAHYDTDGDGTGVIRYHPDSPDGILIGAVAHEIGHDMQTRGWGLGLINQYLGTEGGPAGVYAARDADGNPMVDPMSPHKAYLPNEAFRELKESYLERFPEEVQDAKREALSDEQFAMELGAEEAADLLLGNEFEKTVRPGFGQWILQNISQTDLIGGLLNKFGMLAKPDGSVIGTGLFEGKVASNPLIRDMVKLYTKQAGDGDYRGMAPDRDFYSPATADEGVLNHLNDANSRLVRNENGEVVGTRSVREGNKIDRAMGKALWQALRDYTPKSIDEVQIRTVEETRNGRTVTREVIEGKYLSDEMIEVLVNLPGVDPTQLGYFLTINERLRTGDNAGSLNFYYRDPEYTRKQPSRRRDAAEREGYYRTEVPYRMEVNKSGNILFTTVSPDQMQANARIAWRNWDKTGLGDPRVLWNTIGELMRDMEVWMGNIAAGRDNANDPAIGRRKRDYLNALLGNRAAANREQNPLRRKVGNSLDPWLVRRRLDRMNQMQNVSRNQWQGFNLAARERADFNFMPPRDPARAEQFRTNAPEIMQIVRDNPEGLTVGPKGEWPEQGYVVAPDKDTELPISGDATDAELAGYFEKFSDRLERPGAHFGAWRKDETGEYILDVSFPMKTLEDAVKVAIWGDQDGIFDIGNLEFIATKEDGKPVVPEGVDLTVEEIMQQRPDNVADYASRGTVQGNVEGNFMPPREEFLIEAAPGNLEMPYEMGFQYIDRALKDKKLSGGDRASIQNMVVKSVNNVIDASGMKDIPKAGRAETDTLRAVDNAVKNNDMKDVLEAKTVEEVREAVKNVLGDSIPDGDARKVVEDFIDSKSLRGVLKAKNPDAARRSIDNVLKASGLRQTLKDASVAEARKAVNKIVTRLKNNLLDVYDSVPPELVARWKEWYNLANSWGKDVAKKYDTPDTIVYGITARLSPGKDWFDNVTMTDRILDVAQRDAVVTPEEIAFALPTMDSSLETKIEKKKKSGDWSESWEAEAREKTEEAKALFEASEGKKFSELDDLLAGLHARFWTQTHGDNKVYNVFKEGSPVYATGISWQSGDNLKRAVAILRGGDISTLLGSDHKIRSFYNNMASPDDARFDITMDTHAVAAALILPLSQSSPEVTKNFGGSGSAAAGLSGSYWIYAEAYRRAAKERGLIPREMQSVTWEAIRNYFPRAMRSGSLAKVRAITENPRISRAEKTRQINELVKNWRENKKNTKTREKLEFEPLL